MYFVRANRRTKAIKLGCSKKPQALSLRSKENFWGTPGWKRRSSNRRDVGRCNGLQDTRQRGEVFKVDRKGRRWSRHRCTQRTIHAGRGFELSIIASHVDHFHATARRTDHLHAARLDDRGRYGRSQKQREPNQHQFGDEFGAA